MMDCSRTHQTVRNLVLAAGLLLGGPAVVMAQTPGAPPSREVRPEKDQKVPAIKAPPLSPLQLALKDGIPENSVARVRLRDNLYALLAVAPNKAEAKKITTAIQRVWLTSGSETIDLLMQRALKALGAKKADRSFELLNAVIGLAPDYPEVWNQRAYLHYKKNDFRSAVGDLRRVLALDPKHFKALDGLGTVLRESGDDAGAFKVYERLMDINPLHPGVKDAFEELKQKVQGRGI